MSKGRKAEVGTYEAREYVTSKEFETWINTPKISQEAKDRIKKAVLFGLGIKSPEKYAQQKADKIAKIKAELAELEGQKIIAPENVGFDAEYKEKSKKSLNNNNEDEYFAPEDCKIVN